MEGSILMEVIDFLMKVATQKRKFVKFKKNYCNCFVFYCDPKHSDTLLSSSHVCYYLFLGGCGQKWTGFLYHGTLKSAVESELIK